MLVGQGAHPERQVSELHMFIDVFASLNWLHARQRQGAGNVIKVDIYDSETLGGRRLEGKSSDVFNSCNSIKL